MEVASWSLADDVTNLTFFDDPTDPDVLALGDRGCAQVSVQSAATAMSYQEYELIDKVECVKYTRSYPCCPDSPWTQLWIIVGVKRRSQFYGRFIQFPGIALTMSAFSSFWFDAPSAVSGRIGYLLRRNAPLDHRAAEYRLALATKVPRVGVARLPEHAQLCLLLDRSGGQCGCHSQRLWIYRQKS